MPEDGDRGHRRADQRLLDAAEIGVDQEATGDVGGRLILCEFDHAGEAAPARGTCIRADDRAPDVTRKMISSLRGPQPYRINRLKSVFLARSPTCFCT